MSRIDAVYELLQNRTREWLKTNGAVANGPMLIAAGRELFIQVVGPFVDDIDAIDELRRDEGDAVTILCDNPDGDCAVEVSAAWTGYELRRFSGRRVSEALKAAVHAKRHAG